MLYTLCMSHNQPRLGILLSGGGTTYANIVEVFQSQHVAVEFAAVISSRSDAGGIALAKNFGHPIQVCKKTDEVSAALAQAGCTHIAMCGWMRFWDPPPQWHHKVVNIHPSLLPSFGGKGMYGTHVHQAVVEHGCKISGCTAHFVSGDYDTGPIIAQKAVAISSTDSVDEVQQKVQAAERALYPPVVRALINNAITIDHGRVHCPYVEEA